MTAWPEQTAVLTWEYVAGELVGRVASVGWVNYLDPGDRVTFGAAVSGLFQRTGVEVPGGPVPLTVVPPFTWTDWVHLWQRSSAEAMA